MGLLDDAIREHLEFKRQHGADPTEVDRQEREALGPMEHGSDAIEAGVHTDVSDGVAEEWDEPVPSTGAPPVPFQQEPVGAGEETAELDMRAVLEAQVPVHAALSTEESLEWEAPSARPSGGRQR